MTVLSQTARRTPATALKRASFAAVLMGGLLLTACGGNTPIVEPPPVTTPTVSSVTVTPAAPSITVGATQQLKAEVVGQNSPSTAVTWKSSDTAVLTVDATGLVTAKAAGTATVTATSTADTSQSGSVTVTVKAGVIVPPTFTTVKINFQPAGSATPAGYTPDIGAAYAAAKGSGWITEASANTATPAPLDLTLNTRDRTAAGGVSSETNTFIHMQYTAAGTGTKTNGAWEYTVPNGTYNVTVAVGDPNSPYDSTNVINLEGKPALPTTASSAAAPFATATVAVTVTDGKLTLDAKGGANTKLDYVTIAAAAK